MVRVFGTRLVEYISQCLYCSRSSHQCQSPKYVCIRQPCSDLNAASQNDIVKTPSFGNDDDSNVPRTPLIAAACVPNEVIPQ